MHKSPKVIIIGAGIMGAAIAFRLSLTGVNLTVIEQLTPGEGVSTLSAGWVNWINSDPDRDPIGYQRRRAAISAYHRLDEALRGDLLGAQTGALRWEREQGQTEAMIRAHDAAGSPVETVEGVRLSKLAPWLENTPPLAAFSPEDFSVDAGRLAIRLIEEAKDRGAHYLRDQLADEILVKNGKVCGVRVLDSEIPADVVIVAAGFSSNDLLEPLGLGEPVQSRSTAIIRFECDVPDPSPILAGPKLLAHFRSENEMIMVASAVDENGAAIPAAHIGDAEERRARAAMPHIPGLQRISSSIALRPVPSRGEPLVGNVSGVEGLTSAVAFPGVILAPLIAESVTSLITKDDPGDFFAEMAPLPLS